MAESSDTRPEEVPKSGLTDADILTEALERARLCIEREQANRLMQLDDLRFCTLDQWPFEIRAQREGDPEGARPCLTFDKINQYIGQVVNDERQNRPAIKVRPVDDKADVDTARVLQEKVRHIEDLSSAQIAYLNAGESAVKIGDGYFRIVTEFESESSFDQEIAIKPCVDALSVYLGPHLLPDGSDAEYGFVFDDIDVERFKREWPKAAIAPADFAGLTDAAQWRSEHTVRVAEYFYFDYQPQRLYFLADGSTAFADDYEKMPEPRQEITGRRESFRKTTKWCKLTGVEILKKEDFPSKYIPIVKVVGKEAIIEGKRTSWGLVRPAKDALRAYNYWVSTITEKIGLAPKAPFIGAVGQFATHAKKWDEANRRNFSRLEYDPVEVGGQIVAKPERQSPAQVESAMLNMLPLLEHDVQTALGMFKASVGQTEGDQSGRALLALQRESDTGTFHFPDNLNLSIRHGGRIIVDMIPRVHPVKKILRLVGEDGSPGTAQIDPAQPQSRREIRTAEGVKNIYNPGVGRFDVTVTSGPSYTTKRMEAAQVFSDLAKSATDPIGQAVMRYLTVKNSDFTSSDEAVSMLKAMIPPTILPPEEGQPKIPPQIIAKVQQMGQQLQMAGQKIQELESGAQTDQAKIAADHDAKMRALALEEKVATEKARLAREEFEFQKKLDIDKANHAAWLAEQKVSGEQNAKKQQMDFERECATRDALVKETTDMVALTDQLTTQVGAMIVQGVKQIEQTVEQSRPVSIKEVKDQKTGRIIGGIATYANGEIHNVTIQ